MKGSGRKRWEKERKIGNTHLAVNVLPEKKKNGFSRSGLSPGGVSCFPSPRMAVLPFILRALATALGLGFSQWTSDSVSFTGEGSFLLAVLLLGLFATLLKPVLVLLMLPLVVLTLGVGLWVVNALLVMLTSSLLPGFVLAGWGGAFWCALWVSLFSLGALYLTGGSDGHFRKVVVQRRGFPRSSDDGGRKKGKKDDDVIDI